VKFLHHFFQHSITHRKPSSSPGVVSVRDLFLFYCLERGIKLHLSDLVLGALLQIQANDITGVVLGGGFATRLVHGYECFDAFGPAPPFVEPRPVLVRIVLPIAQITDLLAPTCRVSNDDSGEEDVEIDPTLLHELISGMGQLMTAVEGIREGQRRDSAVIQDLSRRVQELEAYNTL